MRCFCLKKSFGPTENVSGHSDNDPVENLNEGDDAESKTEAKESSKGGDEVHRTHSDASLKLWENWKILSNIFTHDRLLAKEDVDNGNVLFPGIVHILVEINFNRVGQC